MTMIIIIIIIIIILNKNKLLLTTKLSTINFSEEKKLLGQSTNWKSFYRLLFISIKKIIIF